MEQQLHELIQKIKSDGIEKADRESNFIIENAKKQAQNLIKNAKNEAETIIENARLETLRIKESGEASLAQTSRDLLIRLKNQILDLQNRIIHTEVNESLTTGTLISILEKIARNWNCSKDQKIEFLLNKKDLEILKNTILKKLQNKLQNGINLDFSDNVSKGFLVGEKNSNTYFDFTDHGLANALSQYLNPHLSRILKDSVTGAQK